MQGKVLVKTPRETKHKLLLRRTQDVNVIHLCSTRVIDAKYSLDESLQAMAILSCSLQTLIRLAISGNQNAVFMSPSTCNQRNPFPDCLLIFHLFFTHGK